MLQLLVGIPVFAAGGNSGGGGHLIEAGFKVKVLDVFNDMMNLTTESQALLAFDPAEVYGTLVARDRFRPLCASGEIQDALHDEAKMARVYSSDPSVVHLNCKDYSLEDWKVLFASGKLEDIIFFAHEGLRAAGREGENDYGASSSYVKAYNRELRLAKKVARELAYPVGGGGGRCRLTTREERSRSDHWGVFQHWTYVELYADGHLVMQKLLSTGRGDDKLVWNHLTEKEALAEVLSGDASKRGFSLVDLLQLAIENNCVPNLDLRVATLDPAAVVAALSPSVPAGRLPASVSEARSAPARAESWTAGAVVAASSESGAASVASVAR
ncbi:MAG: hypothetical protein NDJ89_04445 [Oligoflexia bacterium]|nr:hypothetical protein [Oligoflexia bacterium]